MRTVDFCALRYVLFDLDGTLLDSQRGIIRCIAQTLEQMGGPALDAATLRKFIGPPFQPSLQKYCGYTEAQALRARAIFCGLYESGGILEAEVIAGIPELLDFLRSRGLRLGVASSKPELYCEQMLRHFGLRDSFAVVSGSSVADGNNEDKGLVIRKALVQLGDDAAEAGRTLMIGDRCYDVLGARAVGLDCIGVNPCGFAAPNELAEAGALAAFDCVRDLTEFLRAQLGT